MRKEQSGGARLNQFGGGRGKSGLVLLHTAETHVGTFQKLLRELAPSLPCAHLVAADLLDLAQTGGFSGSLRARLRERLSDIARDAPRLVLCTCSTLGALAEELAREEGVELLRLDRALADAAVAAGRRILVLAAVPSTMAPTGALFEEVAARSGREIEVDLRLVEGAWALFEGGDFGGYHARIAEAARRRASGADVVVLAQASMAPAADLMRDMPIPVLSSPVLGVKRALAILAG